MATDKREPIVDWFLVNQLVKPEHQYHDAVDLPIDSVRMAWPFKTEEELVLLRNWFRKQKRAIKEKTVEDHIKTHGKAFL
jgi:hypothetical protein